MSTPDFPEPMDGVLMNGEGLNILTEIPRSVLPVLSQSRQQREISPVHDDFQEAQGRKLVKIAQGSRKTVYAIPESYGRHVLKVGHPLDIHREMRVIIQLTNAAREFCSGSRPALQRGLAPQHFRLPAIPEIQGSRAPWNSQPHRHQYDLVGMQRRIPRDIYEGNDEDWIEDGMDIDGEDGRYQTSEYEETRATNAPRSIILRRIGGIPDSIRTYILNQLYQYESKANVMESPENDNLLIRVYLGKNSPWYPLPEDDGNQELIADEDDLYDEEVPLLNFPGHVDLFSRYWSTKRAHLYRLTAQMAHGYALLHWGARFDGRGIEFLLGADAWSNIKLHMLDFEECEPFVCWTKESVVKQLIPATLENERYIPRPSLTPDLWMTFCRAYLNLSMTILKANAGLDAWAPEEYGRLGNRRAAHVYDDWNPVAQEAAPAAPAAVVAAGVVFCHVVFHICGIDLPQLYRYGTEGDGGDGYHGDTAEKIHELPGFFITELQKRLNEQDAKDDEDGDDTPEQSTAKNPPTEDGLPNPIGMVMAEDGNGEHKRVKRVTFQEPFPKRHGTTPAAPSKPIIQGWHGT